MMRWTGQPAMLSAAMEGATMPQVRVKQYGNPGSMQHDMQRMTADGWEVQAQQQGEGHINLMRTILKTVFTGGIGLLVSGRSRSKGKFIVTYVRG